MMTRKFTALAVAGLLAMTACSSEETAATDGTDVTPVAATNDNPDGRTVKIAFSFPGADHGWLAALTNGAVAEAEKWDDIEFIPIEGTNDSATQASQVETLIAQQPDVLIILPHEGGALTPVALQAMTAGIPVINVDREFATPAAFRTWIGGDNYGIGKSAGEFFANELSCSGKVVEIQGLAGISVTEQRSQGFADALKERCGDGIEIVAQQPADFAPDKGLTVMETILQGQAQIDAVYTHDDDMAEGVVAAIQNAGRQDEMFLTGAGGSAAAMDQIAEGGLYRATFLYNPSMAASAVRLARLIALGAGMSDLVEPGVPSRITLPATTVTADNVDALRYLAY
ncbi:MAG: ribose transport system substrate-binding protein [Glaciecola sp.]|jgi:ribose transport system substrate-binding protein